MQKQKSASLIFTSTLQSYNQPVRTFFTYSLIFLCLFFSVSAFAQAGYWQQHVAYNIHVTLNDTDNTLDGDETILYTNHSPDTLRFIYFHLWQNAYKNDKTTFSEQELENGNTDFYFSNETERGYINGLRFTVNNTASTWTYDSNHIDIAKLILPHALAPGQSITIATPFHVRLPYNFSRGGHEGQTYQATQWYPKPAVYDKEGWHQMPYLDQGEFYSEIGDFEVYITLPQNYIIAASGNLQDEDELNNLKKWGGLPPGSQFNYAEWSNHYRNKAFFSKKRFYDVMPPSATAFKTLHYSLQNAHDFAWFGSKLFLVQHDTIQLSSHTVDAFTFYNPWHKANWQNSGAYLKKAIHFYSTQLGDYPYNTVSVVLGDAYKETGGMEYPTIAFIEVSDSTNELANIMAHEVGHNWLYGVLATNERDHAWMDEGINTFYENRYSAKHYPTSAQRKFPFNKLPVEYDTLILQSLMAMHKDQPIETRADSFTFLNYNFVAYSKTAMWLKTIERHLGKPLFDSCMRNYYRQWQYKHPSPQDFQLSLESTSGQSLQPYFNQLHSTGLSFFNPKKTIKPTFLFNEKEADKYNYLSFSPAFGYNYYDKLMVGGLVHNYQFPLNRFRFLIAPLYATGSKSLNGTARASFSTFKKESLLQFSLSGIKYNINSFTQYDNSHLYFGMTRITPSVMYRLYNKDLRSTQRITFSAKSFLIWEDQFGNGSTAIVPPDTFYVAQKQKTYRYVNELSATLSDNRKLYPYDANLTINQGATFLRAGFTGNYFFNYQKKDQGLQARFFAGKFLYLQPQTLLSKGDNDRYLLTLSGPNGYEDYTYSDYFIGRSQYDGKLSQQLMQRDGFFKVSTPLLNDPVGKTDNWLLALNLYSDIPDEINPLNLLSLKIPIQLFVDAGTYSDVWKNDNSNGRFLYDAGFKISIFKSAFSVYLPVVYSKVFRDYYRSFYPTNRIIRTFSFSFDLRQFQPNKINRNLPL